jgi:DNA-binding CsgD family transcriptional regulator
MLELKTISNIARKGQASGATRRRRGITSESQMHSGLPRSKNEAKELRKTGLPAVGEVPWGSHFCVFYETKRDLLDILVPYFRAGVENNELCVCYGGSYEFHTIPEAKRRLRRRVPELDDLLECGKMEILARKDWFGVRGNISISKTLGRFQKKLDYALRRGFSGLRFHGSSPWLKLSVGENGFRDYEQKLDLLLASQPAICACTFPLFLTGAEQILDAARTHQFALTVRRGTWKTVKICDMSDARKEAWKGKLQQLTFRQREVLQLLAEEKNTKEIASIMEISVKTVESHRLQLMRRLKIDNVPGLVRFAIAAGLVSAEPSAAAAA